MANMRTASIPADVIARSLSTAKEMYAVTHVPRVSAADLTPLQFVLQYVKNNTPVILTGAIKHWPAFHKWDLDYLAAVHGDRTVTINVTPNGWGDAVVAFADDPALRFAVPWKGHVESIPATEGSGKHHFPAHLDDKLAFVMPEERDIALSAFADMLRRGRTDAPSATPDKTTAPASIAESSTQIPYLSFQNDNLRTQLPELLSDLRPLDVGLGLGGPGAEGAVDAVNLWIGDERSTSSCHKDHYENLYAVIRGRKVFTLLPPQDVMWLYQDTFRSARYHLDHSHECKRAADGSTCVDACRWNIRPTQRTEYEARASRTPWLCVNPTAPDLASCPLFTHASPVVAEVEAGEVLYLPSMWYHQVAQEGITIAVNMWYDMDYTSPNWSFYNMCADLAFRAGTSTIPPYEQEEE